MTSVAMAVLCHAFGVPRAAAQDEGAWALSGGFDLIETRSGSDGDVFLLDGSFSYGNATDQIMLMTQGGGALQPQFDEVQMRLFYGHTVGNTTWLVGVRKDFKPHPRDLHATVGVQGTVGTRLSWETYVFLSDDGQVTGEGQVIYQLPITGRLYLEPRVAAAWSATSDRGQGVASGLSEGEGALRLRYRLTPKINIYAGVAHERLLSGTRRLARASGDTLQSTMAVIGFGFSL
ncbi:copper resistance protein B [Sphingobium abikonense]|uniref:copper resistance protein B n=1 Tax=Sphingobium abikonense TaxID=86193 RepID=UPI001471AB03|nr:copper resistance protein B [Sphingobium abikonense]